MADNVGIPAPGAMGIGKEYKIIPSSVGRRSVTGIFYGQLVDNEEILDTIQKYCNEHNTDIISIDPEEIVPGKICIAKYGEDSNYYRGAIQMVDKVEEKATINFFDYGNTETVFLKDTAQIPDLARMFVQQAYVCKWKNYTKPGWRKLYDAEGEENDVKVKILESTYDEVAKNMVYTVSIPDLEVTAAEPVNAAVNVKVEKMVDAPTEISAGKPAVVQPIPVEPVVAKAEIPTEAKAVDNLVPATPNPIPADKPLQKQGTTTSTKTEPPVPVIASTLDQVKIEAPSTAPPVPHYEAKVELQTPAPISGTASFSPPVVIEGPEIQTATCGTMTIEQHEQASGGGESMKSYASMFQECSNLLKTDPECHDAICSAIASCGMFLEKMKLTSGTKK
jgi:hypothetical protein